MPFLIKSLYLIFGRIPSGCNYIGSLALTILSCTQTINKSDCIKQKRTIRKTISLRQFPFFAAYFCPSIILTTSELQGATSTSLNKYGGTAFMNVSTISQLQIAGNVSTPWSFIGSWYAEMELMRWLNKIIWWFLSEMDSLTNMNEMKGVQRSSLDGGFFYCIVWFHWQNFGLIPRGLMSLSGKFFRNGCFIHHSATGW